MSTYTQEVGEKLNGLLEKTYDAEKGYKKASENTDNKVLKDFFAKKSSQRYDFGYQLKNEIASYGQKIENGGSITAATHRAWMDVKAFLTSDNEESMLEEALRGEKAAIEEYKNVLAETALPKSTSDILNQQLSQIQLDLSKEKVMENIM
ncbi:PA2169 family four-helix-bundle protein [Cellulophaga baltica]|uniref:ferritin-like domain-containing protein n=1 Tax=Cellulophaga TaxID=104264 RepID=UPI001C07D55A|nr:MULTISPECIES: PA2169 family four-helix-bundle protein [Cellulophaga]MBU2997724.1 PA2169 family four-helix-bundle protein [Cellulophaga baltica]MDO6769119.1 PA2169 family four-helix-bundle protein [Cellulophaga sp. 1_MG-2023]